mmetsp:Transcript_4890/g.13729  ORF Transcript_4890/g.13729 Transcript_4890/m.13729 type:complete len:930 (-) Transcript_4890:77-2866(-)
MENEILARFRSWDTDHTGRISFSEFRRAFSALGATDAQIETTFRAVDANGDGDIDYNEFVRWIYTDANGSSQQSHSLQHSCGTLPAGGPDRAEVQGLLERIAAALARTRKSPDELFRGIDVDGNGLVSQMELNQLIQAFEPSISAPALQEAFHEFDRDGSGWVELREFCAALDRAAGHDRDGSGWTELRGFCAALDGSDAGGFGFAQQGGVDCQREELFRSIHFLRAQVDGLDETTYMHYCSGKPPPHLERERVIPKRHWKDGCNDIHKLSTLELQNEKACLENIYHHVHEQVRGLYASAPSATPPAAQARQANGHHPGQAGAPNPQASKVTMADPRNTKLKVGVIAFDYPGRAEAWDVLCGAAFLGNRSDLGPDGMDLTATGPASARPERHTFANAEAAFQALLFWDQAHRFRALSGQQAVQLHQQFQGSGDPQYAGYGSQWLGMFAVLRAKFQHGRPCAEALLKTGDAYLLNHRGDAIADTLWSNNSTGSGMNWLGMLLMLIRDEVRFFNGAPPLWTDHIQNYCGVDLKTGYMYSSLSQNNWPTTVRNATYALVQSLAHQAAHPPVAEDQLLGLGSGDHGLLWNYKWFSPSQKHGPRDEGHRCKVRDDTKARVASELGLSKFGDAARCARRWPPNCQETKLFLDQSPAALTGDARAGGRNLLGRYDMVCVRAHPDFDMDWAAIKGPIRKFWVLHAAALNVGETGKSPDLPDFLSRAHGLDEHRFGTAMQRLFENVVTVCVTLHIVHLVMFPFGMGAFLRNLPLADPRYASAPANCSLRRRIVGHLIEALLRSEPFLNVHICLQDGSEESKRNCDAFLRGLREAHPALKQRVTMWPNGDCLQLAHELSAHSQHVLVLNGANRQMLGNHWFQDQARHAIDENLHRRSWTMSAMSYLLNNHGKRQSKQDRGPEELKTNVEWMGGQAYYIS